MKSLKKRGNYSLLGKNDTRVITDKDSKDRTDSSELCPVDEPWPSPLRSWDRRNQNTTSIRSYSWGRHSRHNHRRHLSLPNRNDIEWNFPYPDQHLQYQLRPVDRLTLESQINRIWKQRSRHPPDYHGECLDVTLKWPNLSLNALHGPREPLTTKEVGYNQTLVCPSRVKKCILVGVLGLSRVVLE